MKRGRSKLSNKQMWKEASEVANRVGPNANRMAGDFFPRLIQAERNRRGLVQLTGAMRRWLRRRGGVNVLALVRRSLRIDPRQLLLFPGEKVGDYAPLDDIPAKVLRNYSRKIRVWTAAMVKIADEVDAHLAQRKISSL